VTAALSLNALQALLETVFVGRCAVYQTSVTSTMDLARQEAEGSAPDGTLVVADEQTQGQGRRGRRWVSPPGGNIYATIILRPGPWDLRSLGMVAPLAVCEAVDAVADVRSVIKWPNDLLIEGRKVGGVLIDTRLSGDEVEYALVGVGINVNFDPSRHEEIREMATSLALELGREVSREALLAAFLNRFERLYLTARSDESVYEAWKARLETLGRRVEVRLGDRIEEGIAEDVDAEGNLLLRREDNSIVVLAAGDVTLQP
jgi:BirA family biotin operon repressor/biotin-[acetyl-CoA-carboxylase] ligase